MGILPVGNPTRSRRPTMAHHPSRPPFLRRESPRRSPVPRLTNSMLDRLTAARAKLPIDP